MKKKTHFIFPIMKGSMSACMELVGNGTSNKVKNHCITNSDWAITYPVIHTTTTNRVNVLCQQISKLVIVKLG